MDRASHKINNLTSGVNRMDDEFLASGAPRAGTLERLVLEKMLEKPEGVTFLDFVGTGVTEENIDGIIQNLRTGMYDGEADGSLRMDA